MYNKVAQVHFSANKVIPDEGKIDIRQLTTAVLKGSKENERHDFLLQYLKEHLAVLERISNTNGLKLGKDHGRRTHTDDDCSKLGGNSDDDDVERAFRANVRKSKKTAGRDIEHRHEKP